MNISSQIPAAADLANWSNLEWNGGVQINKLVELESLVIQTENTTYELTVICGTAGEVLVRGGQFFPKWTPAVLSGATFRGGSFLKLHGIYVGLAMEFLYEGRQIVTTPVRSIRGVWQPGCTWTYP